MSHLRRFVSSPWKQIAVILLLAACAGAVRAQNLSFTPGFVTAIAGDPTFQAAYSSTSPSAQGVGPASSLVSTRPFGMVFDKDGNLYFADQGFRSPSVIWVIASGKGTLPLVPIAAGSPVAGNAYVVAGGGLGQAGTGSCATAATDPAGDGCAATDAYLSLPNTPVINVDGQGNLYVNDGNDPNSGNPLGLRVVLASSSSTVPGLTVTNPVAGHIYQAQPTAYLSTGIDSHGNLYFHNGTALQVQYKSGTVPGIPAGSPTGLYTIAGGPNATCDYAASPANAAPGGCANGGPAIDVILNPSNSVQFFVQIDPSDNIYLVDSNNNIVRAIYVGGSLPGIKNPVFGDIYTIAGNGQYGQEISGVPATQSPLYSNTVIGGQNATTGPIAFDAAGDLYIAQVYQDFVRVDQSGILTTVFNGNGIPNPTTGSGSSSCLQATDGLGDGCPANQVDIADQGTFGGTALSFPFYAQGIAVDAAGNFYESDQEFAGSSVYGILHKIDTTTGQVDLTGNVGSVVPPQTVQVYNSGTQPLTFTSLAASGADFSIIPSGGKTDCTATTTLAPGTTCQIAVSYTPTVVGNVTGTVTIASNALNATGGVSTLNLLGVGLPGLTGTTLTITPGAPIVANAGQNVTFTATVGPPNGGIAGSTPTGTVTFTDQNGTPYGPANVDQASGSKSGVATFSTNTLAAGSYTITAAYSGDSNFAASTSAPQPVTVAAAATPAPAVGLSASAASAISGASVVLTATVTSASGPTPTGTVTITDSLLPGANILGTGTLSSGTATLTLAALPVGANTLVAYYGGDTNYSANASAAIAVTIMNSASLQIVPGVINTVGGTFKQRGYTGDGGAASSATLNIAGFTSDPAGNLYIADGTDSVVRRIDAGTGAISTVAGNGSAGPSGDGGAATAAQLNSPSLVFADAFGNLYIGDGQVSLTNPDGSFQGAGATAIRRVDAKTGIITTIAGAPGILGYTGDGGLATGAQIDADALFVDNAGNLYFTDVFDQVVRRVNAQTGVINTIAGNGAQCFQLPCGDGGPALSAQFQNLNGIAVDPAGNVYVGDAGAKLVRKITAATGIITTVTGVPGLYSIINGVGSDTLSAIDSAGNLFISAAGQILEVNPGTQASRTVAGVSPTYADGGVVLCSQAGMCGDGNVASKALLGGFVALDGQDNLYIGDSANSVVRKITATTSIVDFGAVVLGSPANQAFTLTNNGSTPLVLSELLISGAFVQQFGTGSANAPADCLPNTTLNTGESCLAAMAFTPIQVGAASGTLTISSNSGNATGGANVIRLAGTGQGLGGTAAQTITFGALKNTAYGATVALSAMASSGLPVSFLVNGPANLTTTAQGTFLKTTGAGTVSVTAYQVGDQMTYKAASPVVQSFTVTPVPLTVAAGPESFTLGSAIPDLSKDFTISGLINGDTANGQPALSTTATASSPCGTYPIHITQGSLTFPAGYAANFVDSSLYVTGTQAQTISFSQPLAQVSYGSAPITLTATASSGLPVSFTATGAAIVSGTTLTITGAGPVSVTANQYGSCQYLAASPVTQTFNVAPAALTVTADNKTVALGTALPTLTYTITGFVDNDPPTVVSGAPVLSTTATSTSPSGSYPISIAAGTLAAANYTFSLVPGTLTINPGVPQTITFGSIPNVTYGAGPISLGATASSGLPITYTVSSGSGAQDAAVAGNLLTILGAGPVMVTASQPGGGTYAPATSVTQTFTVAPAVLTVTASDATRVDYTQNPAFAYTIAGFVNNDPPQVVSGSPSLTTTATPSSAPGNYPIVPAQGSLAALNYTFNFVNGNLTITGGGPAQDYTVTATPQSLTIFDGQKAQTTITLQPVNYYQNTVTFSCGTLPANVTCVFSPSATLSSDGVDPVSLTLTVNTGSAIVGMNRGIMNGRPSGAHVYAAAFLLPGCLLGLYLSFHRKRFAKSRGSYPMLLLLALLAAMTGLTACGSSSGQGAGSNGNAAPGTYSLSLSAAGAGNGPSHTLPISITVK